MKHEISRGRRGRWDTSRRLVLGAALFAAALGARPSHAASALDEVHKSHTLTFGWAEWKPLEYKDVVSGQLTGMLIDMAGAIAGKLDAKPAFVEDSWATLASGVAAGKFQAALLGITPARAKVVDFSRPLYYTTFTAIVAAKGPVKSWDELNKSGNSVSVTTGSNVDEALTTLAGEQKIKAEIVRIKDVGAGVLALSSGKVTGYADQRDSLLSVVANQPQFRVVDGGYGTARFGVGVPKQDPALEDAINKAISQLIDDGTVKQLLDKHHIVGNEPAASK